MTNDSFLTHLAQHIAIIIMQKRQIVSQKLALPDAIALREMIEKGSTTAESVVKEHLERLQIFQPQLNGATQIFKEEAQKLSLNPKPGLLSGIPISIKETLGMAGQDITQGSRLGTIIHQTEDSVIVEKLKAEGAIIIARSNIPEYAMALESDNLLYGRTNNPLNLDSTCGGSSGGEGALVGSGSTVFGIGSDIGGSIRCPAAFCGVVGFKPASDAVDKTGTYPQKYGFSDSMLSLGPITRSVRDAKYVYNIIAKQAIPENGREGIEGLRLFYPQSYKKIPKQTEVSGAVGIAQALLNEGGMLKGSMDFEDVSELYWDYNNIIIHDFEQAMHNSLTHSEGKKHNLIKEAWLQVTGNPSISPMLFQLLTGMHLLRPSQKKVNAGIARIEAAREKYYNSLGDDGILVLPTVGTLAPKHGGMIKEMRKLTADVLKPTFFCNILNLPAITIPAWRHKHNATGLVPGVMLACKPGAEGALFEVAEWLENKI